MAQTLANGVVIPQPGDRISSAGVDEMRALGASVNAGLGATSAQIGQVDVQSRARDDALADQVAGMEGMTYVGAWESGTSYRINDVVTHGGDSWARLTAGSAGEPGSSPTDWGLVARKGDGGGFGDLVETEVAGLYDTVRPADTTPDTGTLTVTSSFPQVTNGSVTIRRYGQMVHATLYDVDFTGLTPPTLFYLEGALPTGYRPATNTSFPALVGSTAVCRIRFQANGQILLYSFPEGGRVNVTASWLTPNPWPAP